MSNALSAAASGMSAMEQKMNVIAHNLANVNTNGFKRFRIEFQDNPYQTIRPTTLPSADNNQVPNGAQLGLGVRTAGTLRDYSVGDIRQTGRDLDVSIEGRGFFQIQQSTGQLAYTRDGALKIDSRGRLVNTDGLPLSPQISLPRDYVSVAIARDGAVSAVMPGQDRPVQVGQLTLVQFTNPQGLDPLGHNLFAASAASGDPLIYPPGQNGTGNLNQGFLEMSNVRAVDEMIDLITTQRAYEMGTRAVSAYDQMLGSTTNLR